VTSLPLPLFQRFLFWGSGFEGRIGASSGRKLRRRRIKHSLDDFDRKLRAVTTSDICLDFGANLGVYTEKLAATGATVHAYEPDPHCFAALQARFAGRTTIQLHNVAVAREAGRATLRRTLHFDEAPDALSQASTIVVQNPAKFQKDGIEVQTLAFADVVKGFDRPVAIVKMDIEGSEFDILEHILEAPDQFPIRSMYVETHERYIPGKTKLLQRVRTMNWCGELPFPIDTYWP
jgi:FkbM family methyltransferase